MRHSEDFRDIKNKIMKFIKRNYWKSPERFLGDFTEYLFGNA